MRNALLILLLVIFPWQAIAAAERSITHLLSERAVDIQYVSQHLSEHIAGVPHHHDEDDDGLAHVDQSPKSIQHLNDFEHGCGVPLMLPAQPPLLIIDVVRLAPDCVLGSYSDRTTLPLLRPPRLTA